MKVGVGTRGSGFWEQQGLLVAQQGNQTGGQIKCLEGPILGRPKRGRGKEVGGITERQKSKATGEGNT